MTQVDHSEATHTHTHDFLCYHTERHCYMCDFTLMSQNYWAHCIIVFHLCKKDFEANAAA